MQRSRSPFAAHQRKKSPRGYSPRKSPFARGSSPKKGRRSPFARGSSPKKGRRSPFACGSSPKRMSPASRSSFACGSSPKGSRWEVTKSPRMSPFARGPSPRKSPFAVKSMKYHLPACYQGYGNSDGSVCRQAKSEYYKKPCYGPKTKDGRPMSCDPGLDEIPQKHCYWGWRNTIWGDKCQHNQFPMKDGKDPNIRCMGGGPNCLVKPKYKDFKNSVSKTSAECYSGFMHGAGKKDPICRRLLKPTKYSNTQCFGPKGKDGKRPTSCDLTNILTEKQIELISTDEQLALTSTKTDKEIYNLARQLCIDYNDQKPSSKNPVELFLTLLKQYSKMYNLSLIDEGKITNNCKTMCLPELELTSTQEDKFEIVSELPQEEQPEALKKLLEKNPEIEQKMVGSSIIGSALTSMSNNKLATVGTAATVAAGLGAAFLLHGEENKTEKVKELAKDFVGYLQTGFAQGKTQFTNLLGNIKEFASSARDTAKSTKEAIDSTKEAAQAAVNPLGTVAGAFTELGGAFMDGVGDVKKTLLETSSAAGAPVVSDGKLATG